MGVKNGPDSKAKKSKKPEVDGYSERSESVVSGEEPKYTRFESESRSVYVGHLPETTTAYDLCKVANQFGQLEMVKLVPKKRCAFLNFIELESARRLMSQYPDSCAPRPDTTSPDNKVLSILGSPVRLSWSKTHELSPTLLTAMDKHKATRNLFVFYGNCVKNQRLGPSPVTQNELEQVFRKFGQIENVVLKPKKFIAFVNMNSMTSALHAFYAANPEEAPSSVSEEQKENYAEGLLLRGQPLVVKFSEDNEQNYANMNNDPRNQTLGLGFNPFNLNNTQMGQSHQHQQQQSSSQSGRGRGSGNGNGNASGSGNVVELNKNRSRNKNKSSGGISVSSNTVGEPPLPEGWFESFDEKSGCKYYYNSQMKMTQWEHPVTNKASPPNKTPPPDKTSKVANHVRSNQTTGNNTHLAPNSNSNSNSRAIILGNLPEHTTYSQVCSIARQHGMIESCRFHITQQAKDQGLNSPDVAFVNFVDPTSAASLYYHAQNNPIVLEGNQLKIGWAKEVPIKDHLKHAISTEGANRSLFLSFSLKKPKGENDEDDTNNEDDYFDNAESENAKWKYLTEEEVKTAFYNLVLAKMSQERANSVNIEDVIESVILRPGDKPFGFVNFVDIISAKKVVDQLKDENNSLFSIGSVSMHVSYVDMRKKLEKTQQKNLSVAARSGFLSNNSPFNSNSAGNSNNNSNHQSQHGQQCRSVILSNFPETTTFHDIAKVGLPFGQIESLHLSQEKNHAFINFVNSDSAGNFVSTFKAGNKPTSFEIRGAKLRVGFGKSVPLRSDISDAIRTDKATRAVYVGGVPSNVTEEELKEVFNSWSGGQYESINILPDKQYAFVNFTSIHTAKKVVEQCKNKPVMLRGQELKVSYGK